MSNARRANNASHRGFRMAPQSLNYSELPRLDRVEIGRTCRRRSTERPSDTPGLHTWDAPSDRGAPLDVSRLGVEMLVAIPLHNHPLLFKALNSSPAPVSDRFFDFVLIIVSVERVQRLT